jgi:Protein of unknown function (DUF3341)
MSSILVEFDSQAALNEALARLAAAGITRVETYTPMPPEAQSPHSPLPWCMFVAGILGFAGVFAVMTYADVHAYPLNIGGRPEFAWPTFVPIAFELGVLCAMLTGFIGYFIACRMPQLYDPVDECQALGRASRDGWLVSIGAENAERLNAARAVLASLAPASLEEYGA